jgi:hypothetical protein
MLNASPRAKKWMVGAAALVAFGVAVPANALVGNANPNGTPPGQVNNTHDKGWRCDDNSGVGQGNPAHPHNCPGGPYTPPEGTGTTTDPGTDPGPGTGAGEWVPPSS